MTKAEIINCLRKYRYDPAHRWGLQGRTVANVCALANTWPHDIKQLRDHGISKGPNWLARVERAIEMIENDEVHFVRGQGRDAKGRILPGVKWRIEWIGKPVKRPPRQDRITRAEAHAPYAPCRTCGKDKWEAVVMHGAPYYVCTGCVGPFHWPTMGARKPNDIERLEMFESFMRENFSLVREG